MFTTVWRKWWENNYFLYDMYESWTNPSREDEIPDSKQQTGSNNLNFRQKIPSIQKYFHLPPTDRSDVSHLERSRAAPISYTVVISGRCWARGRGSVHWRESATWKWHGSMKIIRSGGHAAAGGAIPHVAFVAYHFDNRPTVEKSSCPTRNHQFSLGVRPYAPWFRQNRGKKDPELPR